MRFVLPALIWIVLLLAVRADSARVAVISDADNHDLAALVTAELSTSPDIALVERDALAKIGDELKLQQMAGSDAIALGKLVGADGLLFINKGVIGLQVRFTAVGLGYALFDDESVPADNLPELAKSIAHRMTGYAPKLKLDPKKAVPISVLNLRSDYATTDSATLERNLTLLLESRLAALPEYVVLERRHAWSLGFEHSLSTSPTPLLQGAYVVDGTISLPMQGAGDAAIHLRLRSPTNQQTPLEIHGPKEDLPGLVEQMITEIQKVTGTAATTVVWQPEKEAREYLEEGLWGWQHKVTEPALEALDTAELLGEKAPQLFAVRSEVLGAISSADLKIENEHIVLPNGPPAQPPDQRAAMIIRAIQDAVRFRDRKSSANLPPDPAVQQSTQWIDPASTIIPLASNILVLLDRDAPSLSNEVRTALRELTKFDPEHGTLGPFHSLGHATMRDLFLEEWPGTLKEQLDAYSLICANSKDWLPTAMLQGGDGFCSRFLKTPEDQHSQFEGLVQSLQGIPDANMRYLLILASSKDAAKADSAYKAYLDQLWAQRDAFAHARNYPPDWACARELPDEVRRRNTADGLPLLHYVLANRDRFDANDVPLTILWQPAGWSREDAAVIWKEYQAYKTRVAGSTPDILFRVFEDDFTRQFPDLAEAPPLPQPTQAALIVTRFWYPWRYTSAAPAYYYGGIVAGEGQFVWAAAQKTPDPTMLIKINLTDFSSNIFPDPAGPGSNAYSFVALHDSLYAVGEAHGHDGSGGPLAHEIGRLDSSTGTWDTHPIPDCFSAQLYCAGGALYFFLSSHAAGNEDVIDRYDWDHDATTILASTRRRPAQNQFDDRARLLNAQIYAGPGGKPCLTTMDGTFYIEDTPGPWPEVFDSVSGAYVARAGRDTLVVGGADEVVLLDPNVAESIPLLAPADVYFRKPAAPGTKPVKSFPPWKAQAPWDAPSGVRFYYTNVAYHNDSLYILREPTVKGGDYTLLCYQKGKGRNARQIALRFQLDNRARGDLATKPAGAPALWVPTEIEHPDTIKYPGPGVHLFCAETGICLVPMDLGFWYLPYSDIDAYLKSVQK